jgi:hypothetical protein
MPFRFSLTVLLRLREGIERNQEIMLTTAHQAVRKLEQEIEEVHSTLNSPPYDQTMIEGERNTGAELQFRLQCERTSQAVRSTSAAACRSRKGSRHSSCRLS